MGLQKVVTNRERIKKRIQKKRERIKKRIQKKRAAYKARMKLKQEVKDNEPSIPTSPV